MSVYDVQIVKIDEIGTGGNIKFVGKGSIYALHQKLLVSAYFYN